MRIMAAERLLVDARPEQPRLGIACSLKQRP